MKHYRFFAMLMAVALLLTMAAGCGNSPEQEKAPTEGPVTEAPVQENADTTGDAPEQSGTDSPEPAEKTADEDENDTVDNTSDGAYYNDYFGFKFAPSGWTYYDDSVLQSKTDATYVMAAFNSEGETVSVSVDPTLPEHKGLSEDELYALLLPTEQAQLQQLGLSDASIEIDTTNFLGEEHPVLYSKISVVGVEQKQLYLVKDDQTCIITVTSFNGDTLDAIMGLFSR